MKLYRKRPKSWNLAALALQQISCLRSRLVIVQWSLAPDKKICAAALSNCNFLTVFGIFGLYVCVLCQPLCATVFLSKFGPGQFGNDCFRLAAAIALAKENHCPLGLPDYHGYFPNSPEIIDYYATVYQRIAEEIPIQMAYPPYFYEYFPKPTEILDHCLHSQISAAILPKQPSCPYTTSYHDFSSGYRPIPYQPGIEIQGYFQSEQYFKPYAEFICQMFRPSAAIEEYVSQHYSTILSHPKTVGLHVRTYFKDWINEGKNPQVYTRWLAPDLEFYRRAIELFDEDSLFIVCSDHPEWCEENFRQFDRKFIFVRGQKFIYDFFLLTKCRDMIVMGSTFGWWAAYLNENPEKRVIYRHPFLGADKAQNFPFCVADWIPIEMLDGVFPPAPFIQ